MEQWIPIIVETVLLVPFFGWGVYTVYLRFHKRAESTLIGDGVTTLVLIVYIAFQVHYLGAWGRAYPLEYIFSILGLLVSSAALYGHVVLALVNHVFMDIISPQGGGDDTEPRWGAAEARERIGDYEGALAEYFKLTKKHPHHVLLHVRIAETLSALGRHAQAVPYFRMALDRADSPQRQLAIINRLCDLHTGPLNEPEKAGGCLNEFIEKNPRGPQSEAARRRLERLELEWEEPPQPPLDTLAAHPVEDLPDDAAPPLPEERIGEALDALEDNPLYWSGPPEALAEEVAQRKAEKADQSKAGGALLALDAEPLQDEDEAEEDPAPRERGEGSSLERL